MTYELAQARQRDMMVQAETHRRARQARQARQAAGATKALASGRSNRRGWQLLHLLRPQAQW